MKLIETKPFFLSFLASYFIFLLLICLLGILSYGSSYRIVREQTIDYNLSTLVQTRELIDESLQNTKNITQQLAMDSRVNSFRRIMEPYTDLNVLKLLELQKNLPNFQNLNNLILNYYLYFSASDIVVLPNSSFNADTFYKIAVKPTGMSYRIWKNEFLDEFFRFSVIPADGVMLDGHPYSAVWIAHTLGYKQYYNTNVFFLLDRTSITVLLSRIRIGENGFAAVLDSTERIVASIPMQEKEARIFSLSAQASDTSEAVRIADKNYIDTRLISPNTGWQYLIRQSEDVILDRLNILKRQFIFVILIVLFVGIMLAVLFAYKRSKPLNQISGISLKQIGGLLFPGRDMEAVRSSFDTLEERLSRQKPLLRAALFERLIRGEFLSAQQLQQEMQAADFLITGDLHCISIIAAENDRERGSELGNREIGAMNITLKDELRRIIPENLYIHDLGPSRIAFIISTDEHISGTEYIQSVAAQLSDEIMKNKQGPIYLSSGTSYRNILQLSSSFHEALAALDYARTHQINTCLFDDIPAPINSPYITFDTEVRLLNTAKTGAVSETELLLDEIREENFQEHNLSANAGKILIYDLIAVILRIRHQVIGLNGIDEWIGQITHEAEHTNFYSAFEKLRAAFIEITRQIETRKEKRKESLISRVKNYIDINYSDCNICLYQVSEEFSVSEYHLSRLFKKTTGIAFHDYVEDVRLSKAAQCIQGSNDRIKEIAESVGYTSMTTFGRAFKRKFRVSPTDYRKNALGPGEG